MTINDYYYCFFVSNVGNQTSASNSYPAKRAAPEEKISRRPGRQAAGRKQFQQQQQLQQQQEEDTSGSQKDGCLYDLIRNGKASLTVIFQNLFLFQMMNDRNYKQVKIPNSDSG